MTNTNTNIKLSPKTKVRFEPNELAVLKSYIDNEPVSFANIKNNVGISRNTVLRAINNGWLELRIALPLRDFIKKIPELV
jgi:hypothetical protein